MKLIFCLRPAGMLPDLTGVQTGATFGQLTGTPTNGSLGGPRTLQLALRIDFY